MQFVDICPVCHFDHRSSICGVKEVQEMGICAACTIPLPQVVVEEWEQEFIDVGGEG